MSLNLEALRRRTVEIDYLHKHRHLPGSLSALPIIAGIYSIMNLKEDVFILSKGHACAAHYAVLESYGYHPNLTLVHPERDPANGIVMTSGSLGHGLPTAVGIAWARQMRMQKGHRVHVLMGDGELQEGTTWEALHLAARLRLHERLFVHVDDNGYQGSGECLNHLIPAVMAIYPVHTYQSPKGLGVRRFERCPEQSTHLVTEPEFRAIMSELHGGPLT